MILSYMKNQSRRLKLSRIKGPPVNLSTSCHITTWRYSNESSSRTLNLPWLCGPLAFVKSDLFDVFMGLCQKQAKCVKTVSIIVNNVQLIILRRFFKYLKINPLKVLIEMIFAVIKFLFFLENNVYYESKKLF